MNYLIKIDLDLLSSKDKKTFLELMNSKKLKSFIVKKAEKAIIIKIPLFDYLEYEIFANRNFLKKLRFSLLTKHNDKFQLAITRCKTNSDDYYKMLRLTRLERT